jgi:hypothetical protein
MAKIDELLEDAYDDVKADVVAAIKNHPQYEQLVGQLAERGFAALASLITSAA